MTYVCSWQRLLEGLAMVGHVTEVAPGRLRISCAQPDEEPRTVEVVITRRDWEDMSSVAWGDVDRAATYVRDLVRTSDQPFLVYDGQYELRACPTPELPEDPEDAHIRELVRQHPDGIPGGRWVAHDREGDPAGVPDPEPPPG